MSLWYELNYTLRSIRNKLGFSALCVLVITLGIGVTVPLFALVKNYAHTTLPFPDEDRLVFVRQVNTRNNQESNGSWFDLKQFQNFADSAQSFSSLGAYHSGGVTLSDGDFAQNFLGTYITSDMLAVTETEPLLGRSFSAVDESFDAIPVMLISFSVWQSYYASNPNIVGQVSRVNGESHSIIGVMPDGYAFPRNAEVWLPLVIPAMTEVGTGPKVSIAGLLSNGVSATEASIELDAIARRLGVDYAYEYGSKTARAVPFVHGFANVELFNTVGGLAFCIFLLVCLNVGNLLLIRANERVGELAIRSAMGASHQRLVAHVLLESLLICVCGALFGIFAAYWVLSGLKSFFRSSDSMAYWINLDFNMNLGFAALAILFLLWLFSGGFAAWRASKSDVAGLLASDAKGTVARESSSITRSLVLLQVVFSFFLMVMSGSFLFSASQLYEQRLITESDNFFRATIGFSSDTYSGSMNRLQYLNSLRDQVLEMPEVKSVSFGSAQPGDSSGFTKVQHTGATIPLDPDSPAFGQSWIDTTYFQSMGINLQQGRYFDLGDSLGSEPVVIVDNAFVQAMGFSSSVVGQSIQLLVTGAGSAGSDLESGAPTNLRIVGVVPSIREVEGRPKPKIYRPLNQHSSDSQPLETLFLFAEFALSEGVAADQAQLIDLERAIKLAGASIDRDVSLHTFLSLSSALERENSAVRGVVIFFSTAALVALLLAVIGVYGMISRAVIARTNEIGIRRAIGSNNSSIIGIFLRQGMSTLVVGGVLGGGAAVLGISAMGDQSAFIDLYGAIPLVFISVTTILSVLVFYASYMPVRRILGLEPGEALHYE